MKLVYFTCPGCGAQLNVDADFKWATCPFCNKTFPIDHEVQHLKLDDAERAGYEFEKGRQRAQAEAQSPAPVYYVMPAQPQQQPQQQKHGCLWWVGMILLWMMFLPFMATYYVVRSKDLDSKYKIGIVAAIWIVVLLVAAFGGGAEESEDADTGSSSVQTAEVQTSESDVSEKYVLSGDELGEYGRTVILNENTDMPVEKKMYKLPEGKYKVTTTNEKLSTFYIAKDEIGIEEGNEEYPEILQVVGEV